MRHIMHILAIFGLTAALTLRAAEPNIAVSTADKESGISKIVDGKVVEFKTEGGIATASTDLIQINSKDIHRIALDMPKDAWTKTVEIVFTVKDGQPIVLGASSQTHKVFVAGTAKDQFRLTLNKEDGTTQKHDLPLATMREKIDGLKLTMKPNYDIHYRAMQPSTTSTTSASGAPTASGS